MNLSDIGAFSTIGNKIDGKINDLKSPTPSISLPSNIINENSEFTDIPFTGTVNTHIFTDRGTISNIDLTNKTFTYKSFDITTGVDSSDTIYIYDIEDGYIKSDTISYTITVKYVPMQTDDALVDNDFQANAVNPGVNGLSF